MTDQADLPHRDPGAGLRANPALAHLPRLLATPTYVDAVMRAAQSSPPGDDTTLAEDNGRVGCYQDLIRYAATCQICGRPHRYPIDHAYHPHAPDAVRAWLESEDVRRIAHRRR